MSSRKKVLFSATVSRHIAQFHVPYLKWFKEQGWETWVAAKNESSDKNGCIPYCDNLVNIDFDRSPFSKQVLVAYRQLTELFNREHFDIVHTHTPVGGVLTRLAARHVRRTGTKIIYTAHGFHFYKGAPLINWIMWFPVECVMSCYTDVLITINCEDYERAKKFARCRVEYVPGVGVDISQFAGTQRREDKRAEFGFSVDDFSVLSVGDLIPRKNQAVIVKALPFLPERVKLIICGEGPERGSLLSLADRLGVSKRLILLGFRNDIAEIMSACDCLVFPSIHEGLPVSVIEAMASGLPVIASSIRGIDPDLITDQVSGILLHDVRPKSLANAILELADDGVLRESLAEGAAASVSRFDLRKALSATVGIYNDVLCNSFPH